MQEKTEANRGAGLSISASTDRVGKVYLVGAGPGDPRLLTVRGLQCLQKADTVLFDGLANSRILDWAPQAECISVGKHGQTPIWTQQEINRRLVELARQGKAVVRLKGGDPAVFARTAEELEVLVAQQVPFEVVPGITAALAAASYVGIPITHRDHASAVAFVTGQQRSSNVPQPDLDWDALARFPGTLVFYMGVTTAQQWTDKLLDAGKAPDTPVAIIRRCTWSDQTIMRTRLERVSEILKPTNKTRPPVIVIIGKVAALGENFDWFSTRPLFGCGIVVTRPEAQAQWLSERLADLGADVYHQPAIEIAAPDSFESLDRAIALMASDEAFVQGITFSSSNGVRGTMQRILEVGRDSRVFAHKKIAAVGPATAETLADFGLRADIVPSGDQPFNASSLLAEIQTAADCQHWIVTTTNTSKGTLQAGLRQSGFQVTEAFAYETCKITKPRQSVRDALLRGGIQFCTITSSAIAEAMFQILDGHRDYVQPISLSDSISKRLEQLGWPASATARENSEEALVEAICDVHFR